MEHVNGIDLALAVALLLALTWACVERRRRASWQQQTAAARAQSDRLLEELTESDRLVTLWRDRTADAGALLERRAATIAVLENESVAALRSAHKAEALADLLSGRLDDLLRQHEPAGMADPGAETSPGMGAVSDETPKGDG